MHVSYILYNYLVIAAVNETKVYNRTVELGEVLSLACTGIDGIKTWSKLNNQTSSFVVNEEGSLIIMMSSLMDSGTYQCTIQSPHGTAIIQYIVDVQGIIYNCV